MQMQNFSPFNYLTDFNHNLEICSFLKLELTSAAKNLQIDRIYSNGNVNLCLSNSDFHT